MCDNSVSSGSFGCCESKSFVQDKICNNFTVYTADAAGAEVIYATNASQVIYSSGYIKNVGNYPITAQFVKGANPIDGLGGTIVRQFIIPIQGSFAFTISRFDTIRVFATGATLELPAAGEFCITPRYEVN